MQSNDLQNTGKLQNNMDMVDMIRSLGLHEQRESKKDHQLHQHLNLQEVNYGCPCKTSPVLYALIVPTTVNIVWEECHDIAECEKSVATVSMVPQIVDVNVITIHNVKTKCFELFICYNEQIPCKSQNRTQEQK